MKCNVKPSMLKLSLHAKIIVALQRAKVISKTQDYSILTFKPRKLGASRIPDTTYHLK